MLYTKDYIWFSAISLKKSTFKSHTRVNMTVVAKIALSVLNFHGFSFLFLNVFSLNVT